MIGIGDVRLSECLKLSHDQDNRQFTLIPGEARLSEKCSLYRILEHVDDDSVRMSVCLHGGIKTAAR